MDKLSSLINEARPLYKERKRRNTTIKMIFAITMPVFIATGVVQLYNAGNDIYVSLDNNKLQTELLQDDFGILGLN